jgi:hypothetical protein
MKLTTLLKIRKFAAADRETLLSELIRRYLSGRLNAHELENELERLYNRQGNARSTLTSRLPDLSTPGLTLGSDPLYRQILDLITSTHPQREGLRDDQIDSYANTTSARAVTTERLAEYASRGTEMVQIVAYLDEATTEICRMMHGRIFPVSTSRPLDLSTSQLVQPSSFWQANGNFSQTPTSDMQPFLPPYHYNCRTRIVPYLEPSDPYEAALDRYNNLAKLRENDVQALVEKAKSLEFASRQKLFEHVQDHKDKLGIATHKEYLNMVSDLLANPLKQAGLAISKRDNSLNLYVWNPKVRMVGIKPRHDFAVFSLDKNTLKTFHPKSIEKIMENLDPKVHGKVMLLSSQYTSKGAYNMVDEYDVYCYELILKYFETDDSTDEQEMFSRLSMDKEWDSIPEPFQQRILAVDKIVLEKYADWFNYNVFNDYIACIKARLASVEASS